MKDFMDIETNSLTDEIFRTLASRLAKEKDELMREAVAEFVGVPGLTAEDILRDMVGRVSIQYQMATMLERLICDGVVLLEISPQTFDLLDDGGSVSIGLKVRRLRDMAYCCLEPAAGIEPATGGLQVRCSTAELHRRGGEGEI